MSRIRRRPSPSRAGRSASCPTCSPHGPPRRPTGRSHSSTRRRGRTRRPRREAWRAANALQRVGVEMGDYVSVWLPTGPDVLRAWFGANAAGAVYSPLNLAARGAYLQHTLNLAGSKVIVAHPDLDRPTRRPRPAASRAGRRRRRARRGRAALARRHVGGAARRRERRAADAASARRAVGRPQPHLHVGHDRAVEGRPGLACRLLELRQLLHRALRRRERPLPAAAADVLHGGHGDHVLDAPGGRLARLREGLQPEDVLGRHSPLRGDDHDRDPRHGHVHARPAALAPTTPTTRCGSSTWGRSRATRSSPSASAAASTPPTG